MFGVAGIRVLAAVPEPDGLGLVVETDQIVAGCRACGVLAAAHGRREQVLRDAPFGHRRVRLRWRKRVWRCRQAACSVGTFTETHELAAPRAVLTTRAVVWATDALAEDDTTVSALARRLGVDWHTLWDAVRQEAERRLAQPERLVGVRALGVDEHVVRHEALLVRMEVRDLDRFVVAAAG
jgi:transposase